MAFNFILMLTAGDRTIPDARARLDEALEGGAHNARKPHLRAWILRHAKALADLLFSGSKEARAGVTNNSAP